VWRRLDLLRARHCLFMRPGSVSIPPSDTSRIIVATIEKVHAFLCSFFSLPFAGLVFLLHYKYAHLLCSRNTYSHFLSFSLLHSFSFCLYFFGIIGFSSLRKLLTSSDNLSIQKVHVISCETCTIHYE